MLKSFVVRQKKLKNFPEITEIKCIIKSCAVVNLKKEEG